MNELAKITETGLVGIENLAEKEFFDQGRKLAKMEHGLQWAIGDWYNNIPRGTGNQYEGTEGKAAACKLVGLNAKTARDYAATARQFAMSTRIDIASFKHHRILTIGELTPQDRKRLLQRAIEHKWSSSRLQKERDIFLGRPQEPETKSFDDGIKRLEAEVEKTLPKETNKATINKVKSGIEKLAKEMKHDFTDAVEKSAEAKSKIQRDALKKVQAEAEAARESAIKMKAGVKAFMTKEEFTLIRSCLHPDKNPNPKAEKAFTIFNRLADVKNW